MTYNIAFSKRKIFEDFGSSNKNFIYCRTDYMIIPHLLFRSRVCWRKLRCEWSLETCPRSSTATSVRDRSSLTKRHGLPEMQPLKKIHACNENHNYVMKGGVEHQDGPLRTYEGRLNSKSNWPLIVLWTVSRFNSISCGIFFIDMHLRMYCVNIKNGRLNIVNIDDHWLQVQQCKKHKPYIVSLVRSAGGIGTHHTLSGHNYSWTLQCTVVVVPETCFVWLFCKYTTYEGVERKRADGQLTCNEWLRRWLLLESRMRSPSQCTSASPSTHLQPTDI